MHGFTLVYIYIYIYILEAEVAPTSVFSRFFEASRQRDPPNLLRDNVRIFE